MLDAMKIIFLILSTMLANPQLWGQCATCLHDSSLIGCTILVNSALNSPGFNLNAGEKLCISPTGSINGNWNVNLNGANAQVLNLGTISVNSLNLNQGTIYNYGTLSSNNSLIIGNATIYNHGLLRSDQDLNLNASSGFICNEDSIYAGNNFNTNGQVVNNGRVEVDGRFQQNSTGDWCTTNFGIVWCEDLELNGTVDGSSASCVSFLVSDFSNVNSAGGILGSVDVCDLNHPGGTPPLLDNHTGTIGPNVTYCGCNSTILSIPGVYFDLQAATNGVELRWRLEPHTGLASLTLEMARSARPDFIPLLASALPNDFEPYSESYFMALDEPETYFFRLHGVDVQGRDLFSEVKQIAIHSPDELRWEVGPNPFHNGFRVDGLQHSATAIELRLYSMLGELIVEHHVPAGSKASALDFTGLDLLPNGNYVFVAQSATGNLRKVLHKR